MSEREARVKVPSYRLHKPSGQAIVKLGEAVIYLGEWQSEASKVKYERAVAEWRARGNYLPSGYRAGQRLSVDDLIAAYWKHAEGYYRKDGKPTSELSVLRLAMRFLHRLYGEEAAAEFGPIKLKAVREAMIVADISRKTINGYVSRIKQCFRWGVENELVPGSVAEALGAVRGLRKGRTEARETDPVPPAKVEDVEAVMPHVSRPVAAMIQVQLLTAMRPGEVVQMRMGDLDRSGKVWLYRPGRHKTEHHEIEREIQIGPKAQEVLRPFFKADPTAPMFSPLEAEQERNAERRRNRKTKMWPSHAKRKKKRRTKRRVSEEYDVSSYRRAVARGCEAAGVDNWSPNQLRHTAATRIRQEFGLEAAQAVLGHRLLETTQVYAESSRIRAREAMEAIG